MRSEEIHKVRGRLEWNSFGFTWEQDFAVFAQDISVFVLFVMGSDTVEFFQAKGECFKAYMTDAAGFVFDPLTRDGALRQAGFSVNGAGVETGRRIIDGAA